MITSSRNTSVEAEWDDAGYWDRRACATSSTTSSGGAVGPLILGFAFWSEREPLVTGRMPGLDRLSGLLRPCAPETKPAAARAQTPVNFQTDKPRG